MRVLQWIGFFYQTSVPNFGDSSKQAIIFMRLSTYHKVSSSNTSRLDAHAGFFRLLMKGIFGPYVLWSFDKKLIS